MRRNLPLLASRSLLAENVVTSTVNVENQTHRNRNQIPPECWN